MNRKIGVILSYCLMIIEVMSTLWLTPFIIRTLGDAEYGVYKLVASVVVYLLLLDLGIGNAVTRYVAKYRADGNKNMAQHFLGIATIFYGIVAAVCLIIGIVLVFVFPYAFAKGLTREEIILGQKLLLITTFNTAVTLGIAGFKNTVSAYERYDILKGVSIVSTVVRIGLTILCLKCGMGSIGIVGIHLLLSVLSAAVYILFVIFGLKIKPIFTGNDKNMIKEIIVYCSFIFLQMIATQINSCMDSILLGALVVSSSVAITVYSVGQQITQYFQTIGSAVNGVLMPGIVKMVEGHATAQQLTNEMIRIGRLIFAVLGIIWCGFLVFGRQFIDLWVGSEKEEAFWVALLFMTAYMFIMTQSIGGQILWAMNEHKEQSIIKMCIVLMNLALTVVLIFWRPILGAAIGTFVSLVMGDIVAMNYIFVKKIHIHLLSYYIGIGRGIVPCLALSVVAGVAFSFLHITGWLGLIVNIGIMVTIYCLSMGFFGMNAYEKKLCKEIIRSVTHIFVRNKRGNE